MYREKTNVIYYTNLIYDDMYNMQSNILNELKMTCMLVNKGDLNKIYIVSMR